jgi:c-di-GMP-binding flagellar brake protein YcgR
MKASSDENLDGYAITSRREILFYLHQLINDGNQISVMFNEGRDNILTVLLDVDEETGILTLDPGSSEAVNQRFLASDRNFFVAAPSGIRNQFVTGKPWPVTYKRRPAFAVRVPKKYVRLQRRDYFRLLLPMTQRPACTATLPSGETINASVIDIGLGGVGLEVDVSNLRCTLGDLVKQARLDLKSHGEVKTDLEIRFIGQNTRSAKKSVRLGCQFENLSPAQEQLLQRYITHVQREERARLGI